MRGIDPETGFAFDDTRRYVEATGHLDADERYRIYDHNARRVFDHQRSRAARLERGSQQLRYVRKG